MPQYNDKSITRWEALEHMRERATLWMGDLHSQAVHIQFIKEFLDNSADEADMKSDVKIRITFIHIPEKPYYQILITDTGRGIPLKSLKDCLFTPFVSGKAGDAYGASIGVYGVGAKGVMALSRESAGVSSRKEGTAFSRMRQLKVVDDRQSKIKSGDEGTSIWFEPDPRFIKGITEFLENGLGTITEMMQFQGALLSQGTVLELAESTTPVTDELFKKKPHEIKNRLDNWPCDRVVYRSDPNMTPIQLVLNKFKLPNSFSWFAHILREYDGGLGFDIQLFRPVDDERNRSDALLGAVNRTPILGYENSHIRPLLPAIKKRLASMISDPDIKDYFNRLYKLPIYGFVDVRYSGAKFSGPLKTDFKDENFVSEYAQALQRSMDQLPKRVWVDLYNEIAGHLEEMFQAYSKRGIGSVPGKDVQDDLRKFGSYRACSSKNPEECELFLTEGESAGGAVTQARNTVTQAVYFLQGKSLNTLQAAPEKLRADDIMKDLQRIIGVPLGSGDNLKGLNYKKIIILTDADADGKHITALLIGLFYKMSPRLLTEGHVVVACPPLYRFKLKKANMYIRDQGSLETFKAREIMPLALRLAFEFEDGSVVEFGGRRGSTGKPESPDDLGAIFLTVQRIGRLIGIYAHRLSILPELLEMMAHLVDCLESSPPNVKEISRRCKTQTEYNAATNTLIMSSGNIDHHIPLTGLVSILKSWIIPELEQRLKWRRIRRILIASGDSRGKLIPPGDGEITNPPPNTVVTEEVTVYNLFTVINRICDGFESKRFKGLGEMKSSDLMYTTMDPNTRTTFTISHLGDVDKLFALMDKNPATRKTLLTGGII